MQFSFEVADVRDVVRPRRSLSAKQRSVPPRFSRMLGEASKGISCESGIEPRPPVLRVLVRVQGLIDSGFTGRLLRAVTPKEVVVRGDWITRTQRNLGAADEHVDAGCRPMPIHDTSR